MFNDLSGNRYGRLVVLNRDLNAQKWKTYFICLCDCGKTKSIRCDHLRTGKIQSCGCFMSECTSKRNSTHNESGKTAEYIAWRAMIQRLNSSSYHAKNRYAEKGVTICERWRNSFECFLEDMGRKPTKNHSLDRFPNMNGDYEPANCRWATSEEQQNNRGNNVFYEYNGNRLTISQWAKKFGVNTSTLHEHLKSKSIKKVAEYYKLKRGINIVEPHCIKLPL